MKRLNRVRIGEDGFARMLVEHARSGFVGEVVFDADLIELVKPYRWAAWQQGEPGDERFFYAVSSTLRPTTGKVVSFHRLVTGCPEDRCVDHINHNTLDNRRENLRVVTRAQNNQNKRGASRISTTGIRGVYLTSAGSFEAQAKVGQTVLRSRHRTVAEAEAAAIEYRRRLMTHSKENLPAAA